jgi:ADP-ribose pyrophosphatase YjhB (NUDIX family)
MQIKRVVTCFLFSEGKILLLRRSSRVSTYKERWAAVSGTIETNPDEQALAEIREEVGLQSHDIQLIRKGQALLVEDKNLDIQWIVHPYLFYVKNPAGLHLDWEHQDSKWVNPADIENYNTVPELKEALLAVFRD